MSDIPKVMIIGGGAAGLQLATRLGKKLGKPKLAEITLIDYQSNPSMETSATRSRLRIT